MYYIKLLFYTILTKFMSYEDKLYYASRRKYRTIGTCGGYRLQYVGILLKDSHKEMIFPTLADMVIYLALINKD